MTWSNDTLERFSVVNEAFTNEVNAVTDWNAQTPVKEWEARDVIMHLQGWIPAALKAANVDLDVQTDPYQDPTKAWQELSEGAYATLREHPTAKFKSGDFEGMDLATFYRVLLINDIFMHTWDLTRSQGRSPELDSEAAAEILEGLKAQGEALREGDAFGPAYPCDDDAPIVEQLMAYVGRNPKFGTE